MNVDGTEIDAYSTVLKYSNEYIKLTVHFTSPTFVTDLYLSSRPVAYAKVSYESIDGVAHDVSVRFTVTEELVLNFKAEGRAIADPVDVEGVRAIRMGNGNQRVLNRSGDGVRIDWGY